MIINSLANIISFIFNGIFSFITIPAIPENVRATIYNFFDLLFDNLSLLGLVVDIGLLKTLCSIVIVVFAFERTFFITKFLLNKLPFIKF